MSYRRFLAQRLAVASAIAVAAAIALAVSLRLDWAGRLENLYFDAWHRLAGQRETPRHVALVLIDDATLARHADTPLVFWTPLFARAIETLRSVGARAIVLDFIFPGSPGAWLAKLGAGDTAAARQYDRAFRQELNRGNVALAAYLIGAGEAVEDFILPAPEFLLALPDQDVARHVGLANLTLDADSVVRHFRARFAIAPAARAQGLPDISLAALAAQAAGIRLPTEESAPTPIRYAGPPGAVPHLPFMRLLEPGAASDPAVAALRDKIVIVGAGYAGMNDVHPTPYSNTFGAADRMMSGPEIQANIVETLLSGKTPAPAPVALVVLLAMLLSGLTALASLRLRLMGGTLCALVACVAIAVFAYRAFLADWIVPTAQMQFSVLLALLLAGLWTFSRIEREKRHVQAVFSRYVSPAVLQTLIEKPEMPALGGARCEITVLFSDIRNFTTLSEALAPEEVVELLNRYFERVCTALLAEGATIDKFIGDAVMAEFGAPLAQSDHAERALRAALAMSALAKEFAGWVRARFPHRQLPPFDIGIGIHTGPAVVGNIGSPARMEYTAIGDTVNTASRLEGMTKTVGCPILASAATIAALAEPRRFHLGKQHTLTVKGRQQAVVVVEVWPPAAEEAS